MYVINRIKNVHADDKHNVVLEIFYFTVSPRLHYFDNFDIKFVTLGTTWSYGVSI